MTQYIFGLGTGRCGTASLANLLNSQKDSHVWHENTGLHWWPVVANYEITKERLLERGKEFKYVGNVAYYWIQYIQHVVTDFHNPKFIYLWRDKEEVIESFWARSKKRIEAQFDARTWLSYYPFLEYPPSKDAIARTYDLYTGMADVLIFKYPKQVFIMNVNSLSKKDSVCKLLDFIGIPERDHIIITDKINVGGQAPVKLTEVQRAV